jgi:hypothetical protein
VAAVAGFARHLPWRPLGIASAALRELQSVARASADEAHAHLGENVIAHAQAEEEVMYPRAILVGEYLSRMAR